jgi:peptidoglycan/xylan/chitin deacetylase (PgdA/CDA1 family)
VIWPKETRCAVSLTYDDGLPVHRSLVAPVLQEQGLRATFYVSIHTRLTTSPEQPESWREISLAGHELGNHSVFHPCRRRPPEAFPWLEEAFDLRSYSPSRLRSELEVANLVLRLIDGKTERTYGNTCCDTTIGAGEGELRMDGVLADLFVAARGSLTGTFAKPETVNLLDVGCIGADGRSLDELVGVVEETREQGGWAVFMIHGVGVGTHQFYLEPEVHREFLGWLARQRRTIWTAPFVEVAKYIGQLRSRGR